MVSVGDFWTVVRNVGDAIIVVVCVTEVANVIVVIIALVSVGDLEAPMVNVVVVILGAGGGRDSEEGAVSL